MINSLPFRPYMATRWHYIVINCPRMYVCLLKQQTLFLAVTNHLVEFKAKCHIHIIILACMIYFVNLIFCSTLQKNKAINILTLPNIYCNKVLSFERVSHLRYRMCHKCLIGGVPSMTWGSLGCRISNLQKQPDTIESANIRLCPH